MEVAKAEMVGVVDDDRIHIRDIHAALDDIRTNQHIVFPVDKIEDPVLQIVSFHLTMCISDAEIGAKSLDDRRHFRQALHAVIDKEDLSAAFRFIIDRIPDEVLVISMKLRLDRLPVWRRGIDNTEGPCAHQTEMECPGSGWGGPGG